MSKPLLYVLLFLLIAGYMFLPTEPVYAQVESIATTSDSLKAIPNNSPEYIRGITTGRARALAGGVVGLISLIIGLRAKTRSVTGTSRARTRAITAFVLGSVGAILSIIHLVITAGAVFGSGSGKAGAIAGLILSLTGMTLGGIILRNKNI